jgi:hypothetical protein
MSSPKTESKKEEIVFGMAEQTMPKGNESGIANIVCPESGIESAGERDLTRRVTGNGAKNSNGSESARTAPSNAKRITCESTIESSLRRDMLKKAAFATAAIGIGATALGGVVGKNLATTEESSAKSQGVTYFCCICVRNCTFTCGFVARQNAGVFNNLYVDYGVQNGGLCPYPGLSIGAGQEYISSASGICVPNRGGLDFWMNTAYGYKKSVSITNAGNLGIGTCSPSVALEVDTPNWLVAKFKNNASSGCRTALAQFETGDSSPVDWNVGVAGACNHIPINDGYFYVEQLGKGSRMTIDTSGRVGIGTNTPCRTLCVNGGINASTCSYPAVEGFSVCRAGVVGLSYHGPAVEGFSFCSGPGVLAESIGGLAIQANAFHPLIAEFKNSTCSGDRSASVKFENADSSPVDWNAGVAGLCNVCSVPDGSFYIGQSDSPRVVVNPSGNVGIGTSNPTSLLDVNGTVTGAGLVVCNGIINSSLSVKCSLTSKAAVVCNGVINKSLSVKCSVTSVGVTACNEIVNKTLGIGTSTPATPLQVNGTASMTALGVGTTSPQTTLQVNGSMSARISTQSSNYTMTASDFAILANASNAAITITLPAASTAAGMMVHVKKIDGTLNLVNVAASGSDKIEGKSSDSLSKKYKSLTLISDGSATWYILSKAS